MQAACGLAQLDKLEGFIEKRRKNFDYLTNRLSTLSEFLDMPQATPNSNPSWFGFPMTIKESSGIDRINLLNYLAQNKIGTRLLFAGNLTRQPYFENVNYRIAGEMTYTDRTMNHTFWIGLYPALSETHFEYIADKLEDFFGLNF